MIFAKTTVFMQVSNCLHSRVKDTSKSVAPRLSELPKDRWTSENARHGSLFNGDAHGHYIDSPANNGLNGGRPKAPGRTVLPLLLLFRRG